MMDALYAADISLFMLINQTLTWGPLDVVMPVLTDLNHLLAFRIVVLALVVYALWKGGARGRRLVLVLLLAIIVSDQVNSFVLKEWFGRMRPCHELFDVRLLVDCGGGKSFPSSHAINAGTAAIVISFFYPRTFLWMAALALMIGYSRIYVGVHYPSDVLAGLLLGAAWGWGISSLFEWGEESTRGWLERRTHRQGHG